MPSLKQISFTSTFVFALLATAAAQDSTTAQRSSLTITATAADGRVRITAPSSVVQMRVEVYAASGEKLFDQEIRGGNVFDWHLQDGQAQRLAQGDYLCVVTAKSISGKLTQKIGTVSVAEKSVSVQPADSPKLSAAQAQTIGPVEENSSWTIPGTDELQTPTVIAHDGTDGQMIRGRGALTFRIGDFFSGIDKEQMRLTEEGRLGIGTSNPQAKLDVAGTIRAQRFLVSKPNTSASDRKAQAPDDADSVQPLVAGTGTQDRIAKWTDNAGTLGDSAITETGGNVGIGTTAPGSKLVVSANSATLPAASGVARFADADGVQTAVFADAFGTNPIFNVRRANGTAAAPSAVQASQLLGVIGASGFGTSAYSGTRARVAFLASENWTNTANGSFITFNTTANGAATAGGTERLRIDNAGNVGIGTTSSAARLHVAGASSAAGTPLAIVESSGTQMPLSFRSGATEAARIRSDSSGNLVFATLNGVSKNIFFRAGDDSPSGTNMFVESATGNVGIGTTAPAASLHVAGSSSAAGTPVAIVESSGTQMPLSFRSGATENARIRANNLGNLVLATLNGSDKNIFFRAGDDSFTDMFIESSTGNVGIDTTSPNAKLEVSNGSVLSSGSSGGAFIANNPNNQSAAVKLDWFNDTPRIRFGGTGVGANNGFVIQGPGNATRLQILDSGVVSIGTTGDTAANLSVFGKIFMLDVGAGGSGQLCYNTIPGADFNAISFCSSSLRYKTDVRGFTPGLDLLNRLRPVSFRWKGSGSADLGLVAEEVERVDPLLVTYNKQGQVEGVKYDRLGVVLVNAIKEQQAQIKVQQQQLRAKDEHIANLTARLARHESSLSRYESRLASLERSVALGKRTKRQVTVRANSTRQRNFRRGAPSKAD